MIRSAIIPAPALVLTGIIAFAAVAMEVGIASEKKDRRVVASDATCVGSGVKAGNLVSLSLDCGPKLPAWTTAPATIQQYVTLPTIKFRCELHESGSADCTPITAKK